MAAKVLLALLTVLCAFAALNARPYDGEVHELGFFGELRSLMDMHHVKLVQRKMTEALRIARNTMNRGEGHVSDEAAETIYNNNYRILQPLAEQAEARGVDVKDCLALQQQHFDQNLKFSYDAQVCFRKETEPVFELYETLYDILSEQGRYIKAFIDQYEYSCMGDWRCLAKEWNPFRDYTNPLAKQMGPASKELEYQLAKTIPKTLQCSSQILPETVNWANELLTNATSCFQSKLTEM